MAVCQALGIAVADALTWPSQLPIALGFVALAVAGFGVRSAAARGMLACLVAACAGAAGISTALERAAAGAGLQAAERDIEARVQSSSRSDGRFRALLSEVRAVDGGPPVPTRILITADPPTSPPKRQPPDPALERAATPAWRPRDEVRVRVRLRRPRGPRNPGERDWASPLQREGIGAVGRLANPALGVTLQRRAPSPPGFLDVRRGALETLRAAGPGGSLLAALSMGERRTLPQRAVEAFATLGLSHLLAVSGLHVALFAGMVYRVARAGLALLPAIAARTSVPRLALLPALASAVFYGLITGWGIPVQRALLFLAAAALAVGARRAFSAWHALALASIVVLGVAPHALFSAGAQLSFVACAGLFAAVPGDGVSRGGVVGAVARMVRTTAAANAATAPLVAWHFAQVAPVALIANLVAIPWTALVLLPLSLLAATCAAVGFGSETAAITLAERVAAATLVLVEGAAARLPELSPPAAPAGWAIALAGLGAVVSVRTRGTARRVALVLVIQAGLALAPRSGFEPEAPRLVVLDVGQGDAVIVHGLGGAVLVDAGTHVPGRVERGRRTVVPALAAAGIDRLDLVVVTHADLDHRGGIPAILREVAVGEVWVPFGSREDIGLAPVLAAAAARGVVVRERGAGSERAVFGDVSVRPVWPPPLRRSANRNDRSLVVRVEVAGLRLLAPGDIESRAEQRLIDSGADLSSDVLLLPHHGSRTSSSASLLAAVGAQVAIVSAPCRGRFGMPHPEVLERARAAGLAVWWTGRDGAVVVSGGAEPVVRGYAPVPTSCSNPARHQNR
ncbi:MAG: DNA internalization-related competence protein ComEC/Rec2 [Myxococcales bacterium]|nr:DNA internalization-related competence protein ComEC/Rec2 [Myxococcales bacterium]